MKRINWQLRRYYWQIRSWLPCSWQQKNRFIRDFSHNVKTYLEQNPQVDITSIQNRFGTPKEIAAAFVDEMDTSALLKGLRVRRRIFTTVLVAAIIGLVTFALLYMYGVQVIDKTFGGYVMEEIRIIQ